jgi:hypothetical protein
MGVQRCDGCGSKVRIAGGIGDFWTFESETSGGIDLELADGTDHFLCFDCIERLPDDRDVTADDVAALSGVSTAADTGSDTDDTDDARGRTADNVDAPDTER